MTTLKQIRERDHDIADVLDVNLCLPAQKVWTQAEIDRRHLLNLVERMRPYVIRAADAFPAGSAALAHIDALLKELE